MCERYNIERDGSLRKKLLLKVLYARISSVSCMSCMGARVNCNSVWPVDETKFGKNIRYVYSIRTKKQLSGITSFLAVGTVHETKQLYGRHRVYQNKIRQPFISILLFTI